MVHQRCINYLFIITGNSHNYRKWRRRVNDFKLQIFFPWGKDVNPGGIGGHIPPVLGEGEYIYSYPLLFLSSSWQQKPNFCYPGTYGSIFTFTIFRYTLFQFQFLPRYSWFEYMTNYENFPSYFTVRSFFFGPYVVNNQKYFV